MPHNVSKIVKPEEAQDYFDHTDKLRTEVGKIEFSDVRTVAVKNGWTVVMMFYSVLHLFKLLCYVKNWDFPENHGDRKDNKTGRLQYGSNTLAKLKLGKKTGRKYQALYNSANNYKYFPDICLAVTEVTVQEHTTQFNAVVKRIQDMLKEPL